MALDPSLPAEFKKRFAAWLRIEPRCRDNDFSEGVTARVADPAWMLARQWQVGELQGEDAGSPLQVELQHRLQRPDHLQLGRNAAEAIDDSQPLERRVEQEDLPLDFRQRVRIGQEMERRIGARLKEFGAADGHDEYVHAMRRDAALRFPQAVDRLHELDYATQRFVRSMRGRVIDGVAVLRGPMTAPTGLALDDAALELVRKAVVAWHASICARPTEHPPAWTPESLDYRLEARAGTEGTRLVAPDYRNGALDWHAFSIASDVSDAWHVDPDQPSPIRTTPTRIRVSGNSPRWWAFEDGQTDFGAIDVETPALSQLLLMELALVHGDDWFSLPVPVPLGSLVRIDDLAVTNVFGDTVHVTPARTTDGPPSARFDLFTLSPLDDARRAGADVEGEAANDSDDTRRRPVLYVPPVPGARLESPALEEVRFLRDEGANQVWAVEHTVRNGIGRAVSGASAQRERVQREAEVEFEALETLIADLRAQLDGELSPEERAQTRTQLHMAIARAEELQPDAEPTPSQTTTPRYRLATQVPANWIPFIPTQAGHRLGESHPRIELRRAQMLRNSQHAMLADGQWVEPQSVDSMSRVLALDEHALTWLNEETVPRAGVRVQLTKQRVRWTDGSTHVWVGRKILVGFGEGHSGLRFDTQSHD